ncbi:MAG TPA: tetratricopeptide repeat protein [Candidatus Dormibacteraeota bacterium]|jgi:tetratricopeptide (TPR) repeat protein
MKTSAQELVRQGSDAFSVGRMALAADLLGRAALLMTPDDPARLELLPNLGSALARTGQLAGADAVLNEAIKGAVAIDAQRLESHARVERALWRLWSDPDSEGDARLTAESALGVFEEHGDELGLAKAWRLLHDVAPTWDEGQEALARALAHAQRAGDQREEAEILWWVGVYFVFGPMPAEDAIRRCEEILSDAKYDGTVRAGTLGVLGVLYAMRGRFAEAREHFAHCIAILEELGVKLRVVTRQHFFADIELLGDDPAAAERAMRWAYDREVEMGEKQDIPGTTNRLADALYRQGRYEEAAQWIEIGGAPGIRALLAARRGDFEQAETLARKSVAMTERGQNLNARGTALLRLAEVLSMAGRSGEAVPALNEAIKLYERKGNLVSAQEARALLLKVGS